MNKLEVIDEKGLQDVMVFRLCDSDAVAAYSQEEARTFYKELTGVKDDELFTDDEVEIISLDSEIWDDEDKTIKKKLKDVVNEQWDGEPFIAVSWDY
ncbi:hypothetical protein J2T13_000848 [Paenibacillus sp. DS2015]|uniref:hypothetical protein n=1 Tax=Paenibacillus sp. DS2015 TaxID=3373917 RepID=UPI003D25ECFB